MNFQKNYKMPDIPQIIHLIFLSKKEKFPGIFRTCMDRIKEFHPKWEIKLYNEDDAQKIIKEYLPELLPIYNAYPHYVQKADLFRIILVYVYGGFYLDLDMICLKPLDELIQYKLVLPEERYVQRGKKHIYEKLDGIRIKHNLRLGNYMFGGIPQHKFWLYYFKEAIKKSSQKIKHEGDVLETTGPGLLTNVYHKYNKQFPELYLLKNLDRKCLNPNHNEISCHFGNFAAHMHTGTWRWMHKKTPSYLLNQESLSECNNSIAIINKKLKNVESNYIRLYKPDIHALKGSALLFIYNEIKSSCVVTTKYEVPGKIIYFGNPLLYKEINPKGFNILVSTPELIKVKEANSLVNKNFSQLLLLGEIDSEKKQHIHIPLKLIKPFYLRSLRDLNNEVQIFPKFTVGIYLNEPDKTINICQELISLVKVDNEVEVIFLHSNRNAEKANKIDNFFCMDLLNEKKSSTVLNNINACILFAGDEHIEDVLFSYTNLYLGNPVVIEKTTTHKTLRRYCKLSDNKLDNAEAILREIKELKNNYKHWNNKALQASTYIEDRYSLEKTRFEIFSKILNQSD